MKLFKRHKTKDKVTFNVGIRECRTCENNLRCEECVYPSENEMLKSEIERLNKELHNQRAEKDIFKESYYSAKKKLETAKNEAMQDFWNELKKRSTLDWRIVSTITGDNILKEKMGENNG